MGTPTEMPQAQEDWYNGIKFRSKLESKTAQALDNLNIKYVYEPDGYKLSNGMWYKPDFFLPDAQQYIECKGVMSKEDSAKILGLVHDTGKSVVAISYDHTMLFTHFWNEQDAEIVTYSDDEVCIAMCAECGKLWFMSNSDTYECLNCGAYDGDHHLREVAEITSGTEFFRLGQSVAASNPIYQKIADQFNN